MKHTPSIPPLHATSQTSPRHPLSSILYPRLLSAALLSLPSLTLAAGTEVFRDDFSSASFDTTKWTVAAWTSPQDRTQWGPNPFIPTQSAGIATLRLDTYNPASPGTYLKGTEILTKTQFSLNAGMEFETRLRVNTTTPGIIAAFYTYAQRVGTPTLSDEIDFEIPTKENSPHPAAGDKIYLNNWNDWYSGANANDTTRRSPSLQTITTLNTNQFNTYTIRWLPDRTEWLINGVLARTTTQAVPNDPMYLLFNLWAPDSGWTSAYSSSLQPTANPANNVSHTMDLDYAVVRQLAANTWTRTTSGTWSVGSNWNTAAPSGAGVAASFQNIPSAAVTVTLDSPKTLGSLSFDSANPYTLAGASLTLDSTSGAASVTVSSGSHTISSPVTLSDNTTVSVAANSNLTLLTVTGPSLNLSKIASGTLKVSSILLNSLTISGGTVQLLANQPAASKVATLTATTGLLDLTNNSLVLDYTGASPASTIRLRLSQARTANGSWTGATGITSSTAAGDPDKLTTLAYAEASTLLSLTGAQTATWNGQTVDATSLLLAYTVYGDANLDGAVTADDIALLDRGFRQRLTGWTNGDFDLSGSIDSNDYLLINRTLLSQGVSPVSLSSIPEPAGLASLFAGALCLTRRRAQRC